MRIESSTRSQSNSDLWFKEREWRLTASRFGEITKITERRNVEKLCQLLIGLNQVTTSALNHGRTYESAAIKQLEKVSKQCLSTSAKEKTILLYL